MREGHGRRQVIAGGAALAAAALPPAVSAPVQHLARHLRVEDTIGTLLDHPALTGFAPLLLPWDDRGVDREMPLSGMASLMPFHSCVDPANAVAALNRIIDDVIAGVPVFLDIYTDAEKQAEPAKARTGLFFFRGPPGAPFAVICPGGGFAYVGSLHEGFPYAVAINGGGCNAFVLRYRPGGGERTATKDLAAAMSTVFRHAGTLGVSTAGYALWGSSAGARMAANIGSHGATAFEGEPLPGPSTVVMAYTAHTDRAEKEPSTFAIVGEQDSIAPVSVMMRRVAALHASGTAVEFLTIPNLGHGFGLGVRTAAEGWINKAMRFWITNRPQGVRKPSL